MKEIKLIFSLVLCFNVGFSQCKIASVKHYQGNVLVFDKKYEYGNNGQLIKESAIDSPINKTINEENKIFNYNSEGKIISEVAFVNGEKNKETKFIYDAKGQKIGKEEYINNNKIWREEFNGNKSVKSFLDKDGKTYLTEESISDSNANVIVKNVADVNQKLILAYKNKFNNKGFLLEKEFSDLINSSSQIIKYRVSEDGKIEDESIYDNDKLISRTETQYLQNRIIVKSFDGQNRQQSELVKQLGAGNLVISEILSFDNKVDSRTIYTYDKLGNKIKAVTTGPNGKELSRIIWDYICKN